MTLTIILEIILLGFALSMDSFAVSVADGLTYRDINKEKSFFIAGVFGLMQGLMPLIGFFLVEGIMFIVGESAGNSAGNLMSDIVSWVAFALLIYIGLKMLLDALKSIRKPIEEKKIKNFNTKEVLVFGLATSIDALGTGVALHSGLSNIKTIWFHCFIITIITFIMSLIGLFLGRQIEKLLKGKFEITGIIGGIILLILGFWIILSHYLGI